LSAHGEEICRLKWWRSLKMLRRRVVSMPRMGKARRHYKHSRKCKKKVEVKAMGK
jgi:hypothetical protein